MVPRILLFFILLCHYSHRGTAQAALHFPQLWDDLLVLSHDSLQGRKTGTQGNLKAQKYISSRFKQMKLEPLENGFSHQFWGPDSTKATNLIGIIDGRTDRLIVLSAHYDHLGVKDEQVFNGADDNASGVSVLLFMANHFAQNTPHHTLVFVAFDAEEQGLLGSKAFINAPPIDLQNLKLNVNLDMVSRGDKNEIYASGTYHHPSLKPILQRISQSGQVNLLYGHDQPTNGHEDWTTSSDHGPFHKAGYPYLYFGVEDHADYHQTTDIAEKINKAFFFSSAELILKAVKELDRKWRWTQPKQ